MAQVDTTYGTYRSAPLFIPQVVADIINSKLTDKMVFAPMALIDSTLSGGPGDTVTLPIRNYIGAASAVSEGYDIPLKKMTQTTTAVTVVKYANAVQITDEAQLSAFGDQLGDAATQLATSIDDCLDNALLAALAGNTAASYNYATSNASTALDPTDIPLALAKFGEDVDGDKVIYVTPDFHAKLLANPASVNWIPASELSAEMKIRGTVGMAFGCRVVVTNRLVTSGNLYIVKPQTLAVFKKRDVLVEMQRDIRNQSTLLTATLIAAPYLLNPKGMIKMSVGS